MVHNHSCYVIQGKYLCSPPQGFRESSTFKHIRLTLGIVVIGSNILYLNISEEVTQFAKFKTTYNKNKVDTSKMHHQNGSNFIHDTYYIWGDLITKFGDLFFAQIMPFLIRMTQNSTKAITNKKNRSCIIIAKML